MSTTPDNPSLRNQLRDWLAERPDDALTWVECHGLVCAMTIAPQPPDGWQQLVLAEGELPAAQADSLEQLRQRYQAQLCAGESLVMPCRLDPYAEDEGNDLVAWCMGFMAGASLPGQPWFETESDEVAEKMLPFVLIAGVEEDEALDALWADSKLTRQMAIAIPDMIEELFLLFNAPEAPSGEPEH